MKITAWSAVSPYGLESDAFAAGVRARRTTIGPVDERFGAEPGSRACLVPDFDIRAVLGKKGTRDMNRVTALAVTAVGTVLGRTAGPSEPAGPDTALVLGTTTGSVQSMTDFTRASLTGDRPYDVEPGVIPNSVMNCAAAQCAIRHGIQGPNTTLAAGRAGGLLALVYARRLLRTGRARAVLCGGAEEYSAARSWLEARSRDDAPALLGEGAALLRVEDACASALPALATVLAVHSRVLPDDGDTAPGVREAVEETLASAGVTAADIWAAVPSGLEDAEREALGALFPRQVSERIAAVGELIGDTGAAAGAFQLASVVAAAPEAAGRHAVITSVDPQGLVAAAVLRLGVSAR